MLLFIKYLHLTITSHIVLNFFNLFLYLNDMCQKLYRIRVINRLFPLKYIPKKNIKTNVIFI